MIDSYLHNYVDWQDSLSPSDMPHVRGWADQLSDHLQMIDNLNNTRRIPLHNISQDNDLQDLLQYIRFESK